MDLEGNTVRKTAMAEGDLPGFSVTVPFFIAPRIPFLSFGCWRWRDLAGVGNSLAVPLEALVLENRRTFKKDAILGHAG